MCKILIDAKQEKINSKDCHSLMAIAVIISQLVITKKERDVDHSIQQIIDRLRFFLDCASVMLFLPEAGTMKNEYESHRDAVYNYDERIRGEIVALKKTRQTIFSQRVVLVPLNHEENLKGFLYCLFENRFKTNILRDSDGLALIQNMLINILNEREWKRQYRKNKMRYKNLFEKSNDAIFLLDQEGNHLRANKTASNLLGYSENELNKLAYKNTVKKSELGTSKKILKQLLAGDIPPPYEKTMIKKDGTEIPVEINLSLIKDKNGRIDVIQSIVRDISGRKEAEMKLIQKQKQLLIAANHDSLTNLYNRRKFKEKCSRLIKSDVKCAFIYIDINRFKIINDTLGHVAGDVLLIQLAGKLKSICPENSFVGRLGGDEFAILLEESEDKNIISFVKRLIDTLEDYYDIQGWYEKIRASIGIAKSPIDGTNFTDLFKHADIAMYESKARHVPYVFFKREHSEKIKERLKFEQDIEEGIKQNAFFPFYQPIVDTHTQAIKGYEALVRWQKSKREIVTPYYFLPSAEKMGLLNRIDNLVRHRVAEKLRRWRKHNCSYTLSINISANEFLSAGFDDYIEQLINDYQFNPHQLIMEITEGSFLDDLEICLERINFFKRFGIKISIDDFGTGYSSFSYLNQIPADYLKIDREFIKAIDKNEKSRIIVKSIIDTAHNLGFQTVSEGVETEAEYLVIKELKSDFVQGYYFGKPAELTE